MFWRPVLQPELGDPTLSTIKGNGVRETIAPSRRSSGFLVPYLAAVGAAAIPCQNLTCLIRRNHALSIHCNKHPAALNSRAIELGLLPGVPRFA